MKLPKKPIQKLIIQIKKIKRGVILIKNGGNHEIATFAGNDENGDPLWRTFLRRVK